MAQRILKMQPSPGPAASAAPSPPPGTGQLGGQPGFAFSGLSPWGSASAAGVAGGSSSGSQGPAWQAWDRQAAGSAPPQGGGFDSAPGQLSPEQWEQFRLFQDFLRFQEWRRTAGEEQLRQLELFMREGNTATQRSHTEAAAGPARGLEREEASPSSRGAEADASTSQVSAGVSAGVSAAAPDGQPQDADWQAWTQWQRIQTSGGAAATAAAAGGPPPGQHAPGSAWAASAAAAGAGAGAEVSGAAGDGAAGMAASLVASGSFSWGEVAGAGSDALGAFCKQAPLPHRLTAGEQHYA